MNTVITAVNGLSFAKKIAFKQEGILKKENFNDLFTGKPQYLCSDFLTATAADAGVCSTKKATPDAKLLLSLLREAGSPYNDG